MSMTLQDTKEIRKLIPNEQTKRLHRINDFKGIGSIFLEWGSIFACAWLCERYFSWYFYLFTVIFIGARYLALGLIMHESVHQLISKNKFLNDWLSEIFCSWPLIISMRSYRVKHLAHHARLNTEEDPDYVAKFDPNWRFPMKKNHFSKVLAIQLSGLGVFETFRVMSSAQMKTKKDKAPRWYTLLRITFYLSVLAGFIFTGNGMNLVLYWLIPFVTWTQIANRLRRIAEHSGISHKSPDLQTRTTTHGLLARIFLAPKFISYHNEHHIYPGIPCYNLRATHRVFNENELIKQNLHVSKSYFDVYRECVTKN
jgi:fatty acid desaturase